MELLAPAGDEKCFRAAVDNGADAVYLGGKIFNARSSAGNFSLDELKTALEYAHLRGVKIYVTVNILIADNELSELLAYLEELLVLGVDGVIVQDHGVVHLIRKLLPDLPLHISTQMTVHNLAAVKYLEDLGVKRVVLSRELSLEEIKEIGRRSKIELEVFAHGALCVSYSGQCLFSSMIGGRSGNRGRCAQPCRLPYHLVDQNQREILNEKETGAYLLSPRDLKTIELLPQLRQAGVHSLKIEGRMKKPEYVATVVRIYRQALDRLLHEGEGNFCVAEDESKDLAQIFNRDFTSDYLLGKSSLSLMSYRRPNNRGSYIGRIESYSQADRKAVIKLEDELIKGDGIEIWVSQGGRVGKTIDKLWLNGEERTSAVRGMRVTLSVSGKIRNGDRVFKTYDERLERKAKESFVHSKGSQTEPVNITVHGRLGEPLVLLVSDRHGHNAYGKTHFLAEKAKNKPLNYQYLRQQLGKLGNTVFYLQGLTLDLAEDLMVPVSEINQARREALAELTDLILAESQRTYTLPDRKAKKKFLHWQKDSSYKIPKLAVLAGDAAQAREALNSGADRIYFGGDFLGQSKLPDAVSVSRLAEEVLSRGKEFYLATPRILKTAEFGFWQKLFEFLAPSGISGVMAGNMGIMALAQKEFSFPLVLDTPFNVFNRSAVQFWQEQLGERLKTIALSPELNLQQIRELATAETEKEILGEGNLILTVMEHCPLNNLLGKGRKARCSHYCKQQFYLQDRKNVLFPLKTNPYCRSYLLNSMTLSVLDNLPDLLDAGLDYIRLELNGQKKQLEAVGIYRRALELLRAGEDYLQDKAVQAFLSKRNLFTKGHYFRGV